MKHYLPLLYMALGGAWLAYNRTPESALILFAMVIVYFIVGTFRKKSSEPVVLPPEDEEEFHNDFSRVGSADPNDSKVPTSACAMRKIR